MGNKISNKTDNKIINLKNYINSLLSNPCLLSKITHKIFEILSQLTHSPCLDCNDLIKIINSLPSNNNIYVYVDNEIKGLVTLIIEQKLIHGGKCVGHIEDLVVDKNFSGKGIARELVNHCVNIAESNNCYKIILDCKEELEPFYNKLEFKKQGVCMRK